MYQVIARKYRPQIVRRADRPGTRPDHAGKRHHAAAHRPRLHLLRPARDRQDHGGAHPGPLPELRQRAHDVSPAASAPVACEIAAGIAPDVIEIDAASNRGINEMRELRENVRYRPARDRYKVFIVDEAHQITSEAFNALLKTLEEPPEWVVFILCTTEAHKIPTTIASRCQQFSFRSVDFAEIVTRMEWICRAGRHRGRRRSPGACWRRRARAACAIRSRRWTRRSPAAAPSSNAAEVRALLGMFSLESLGLVTEALDERRFAAHARDRAGTRAQRPQPAALLPRAGALLPQPAGGSGSPAPARAWSPHPRPSRNCWPRPRRGFPKRT